MPWALIDEIMHLVVGMYQKQRKASVMEEALDWLTGMLGEDAVEAALLAFTQEFPPLAVYKRELTAQEYLAAERDGSLKPAGCPGGNADAVAG